MATKIITQTVASAPGAVDVPAAVLAAVKVAYPAAATAYPFGDLVSIDATLDGKTNVVVRVTYPG